MAHSSPSIRHDDSPHEIHEHQRIVTDKRHTRRARKAILHHTHFRAIPGNRQLSYTPHASKARPSMTVNRASSAQTSSAVAPGFSL